MIYTTLAHLYARWGMANVQTWARRHTGEETAIEQRITMAVEDAESLVQGRLAISYVTPFKTFPDTPKLITKLVEMKTVIDLQAMTRGLEDEVDTTLSLLQDEYDNLIGDIVQLRIIVDDATMLENTPRAGLK